MLCTWEELIVSCGVFSVLRETSSNNKVVALISLLGRVAFQTSGVFCTKVKDICSEITGITDIYQMERAIHLRVQVKPYNFIKKILRYLY